ncbi:MAG TPA: hypothetical protein VJ963_14915 [Bacteroidales bacterium]|nr:hypothetical protein [Bacteroidales bacterium]
MTYSPSYRRILTRMGYYGYQNALIFRHVNQFGGWDGHLERCREFILKAVDLFKPEHVTVIGSGWLLDFPLAELSERLKKVTLLDVIHPPDVRKQTERLGNVELMETDATGGLIAEVYAKTGRFLIFKRKNVLSNLVVPEFKPDSDPGMVISLNVLTQLEARILEYLGKKARINEEEILKFREEIQIRHLDFLKKHRSVLITDYAELITGKKGETKTIKTLLTELPEPLLREEWIWNFDLHGSDYYTNRSTIKVLAIAF